MKNKKGILALFMALMMVLVACSGGNSTKNMEKDKGKEDIKQSTTHIKKKNILVTSTMLTDLVKVLVGDKANVEGLIGVGVDPHEFEPSASDVKKLKNADIIIYSGLHLEGKMGELFENLQKEGKVVIAVSANLPKDKLLDWEEENVKEKLYDPHFWNSVEMWNLAAKFLSEELSKNLPEAKDIISTNYAMYGEELTKLHKQLQESIKVIPEKSRYLITAHDAFQYLARDYGLTVKAVQGVSTETEANTKDIEDLAKFIVEHDIKSIFVESSVSNKNMKALQEAVKSMGKEVKIGGELYSDSLGDSNSEADTYVKMMKANLKTIVEGLK